MAGRPCKWTGIIGSAAAKVGGAEKLATRSGLSYSTLRRYSLDEGRMPTIIREAMENIAKGE